MAKNNTSSQTTTTAAPKLVCCLNCLHAALHRYEHAPKDPILSACHKKPQPGNERFPYKVEVACHLRRCGDWAMDPKKKEVELRSKVA